jgi:cystathionine gamma-synthase
MKRPSLSPETLVAQGLGGVDKVTGAIMPAITLSTNYEQEPGGSYHQDKVYTRADNPTYEHAERLLATLEGRQQLHPISASSLPQVARSARSRGRCTTLTGSCRR